MRAQTHQQRHSQVVFWCQRPGARVPAGRRLIAAYNQQILNRQLSGGEVNQPRWTCSQNLSGPRVAEQRPTLCSAPGVCPWRASAVIAICWRWKAAASALPSPLARFAMAAETKRLWSRPTLNSQTGWTFAAYLRNLADEILTEGLQRAYWEVEPLSPDRCWDDLHPPFPLFIGEC